MNPKKNETVVIDDVNYDAESMEVEVTLKIKKRIDAMIRLMNDPSSGRPAT